MRSDAKKNSQLMQDYSILAMQKSSPKTVTKTATMPNQNDSFTIGALGSLKNQLMEKQKSLIASDYVSPNFSQRKHTLNVPSRNEL